MDMLTLDYLTSTDQISLIIALSSFQSSVCLYKIESTTSQCGIPSLATMFPFSALAFSNVLALPKFFSKTTFWA